MARIFAGRSWPEPICPRDRRPEERLLRPRLTNRARVSNRSIADELIWFWPGRQASVAPELDDLRVLWAGRDRPLKVAEIAEHVGVCNATVHRQCNSDELPHFWIVNAIRIRPEDLRASWERQAASRAEPVNEDETAMVRV
jgi:hypothetical protein